MIAAKSAAAGDSRGRIAGGHSRSVRTRWLPGHCGLLPQTCAWLFRERGAKRAAGQPQRLRVHDRVIMGRQSALANAALIAPPGASAVGLERSFRRPAVTKAEQESTYDAVGVAGPDRIRFLAVLIVPPYCHPERSEGSGFLPAPRLLLSRSTPLFTENC
jgi:hypothetical protein